MPNRKRALVECHEAHHMGRVVVEGSSERPRYLYLSYPLFPRRGNSWHGVRRIDCPEGCYRKVFIVVFEEHRPLKIAAKKFRRRVTGKPLVTYKESLM